MAMLVYQRVSWFLTSFFLLPKDLPSIWLEKVNTPKTHLSEETFCSKKGSKSYRPFDFKKTHQRNPKIPNMTCSPSKASKKTRLWTQNQWLPTVLGLLHPEVTSKKNWHLFAKNASQVLLSPKKQTSLSCVKSTSQQTPPPFWIS